MKEIFVVIALMLSVPCHGHQSGNRKGLIGVYRWFNTKDSVYRTLAENEFPDAVLAKEGWKGKTLMFYGYKNAGKGRVPVYEWTNTRNNARVSVCGDEFTDEQMTKWGYAGKRFQFFAATARHKNTLAVYRWYMRSHGAWLIVPDDGTADKDESLLKDGFQRKTFQYYGVVPPIKKHHKMVTKA